VLWDQIGTIPMNAVGAAGMGLH